MKKNLQILCLLGLFFVLLYVMLSAQSHNVQFVIDDDETPVLSLQTNTGEEMLYPWVDEHTGILYFFMPAFVHGKEICFDHINAGEILIAREEYSQNDKLKWEVQKTYTIQTESREYEAIFMKSENLPALFLETESGSMEFLNGNKENEETGFIQVVQTTGDVSYQGSLNKVSARGNSTFEKEKKAYTFTLNEKKSLCGLDAGKKWNLLALCYENNKMQSKIIYEMADYLGMEYTPGCTWVDLYCNGKYQGLYLLTEAITVGDGRVDIYDREKAHEKNAENEDLSGGYLLERDVAEALEAEEVSFSTDICNYTFVMKNPGLPDEWELDYIKRYIQDVENMLVNGEEPFEKYLDFDSFAGQFLIDKLVLNPDAMRSSTFYYKDRGSDILKAGPLWDYDRAMGVSLPDYQLRIGDYPDTMNDWYMPLYNNEEFYNVLIDKYQKLLPFLEELLSEKIDSYAEMLTPAIAMDTTMWPFESNYTQYESSVKYLKYFLANRICFLNELWEVSGFDYELPDEGEECCTVSFFDEQDVLVTSCQVKKGDTLSLPDLDTELYKWRYHKYGDGYDARYPIYEDVDVYAEARYKTDEEYTEYKIGKIREENSLETYLDLIKDSDLSICIYLPAQSALHQDSVLLSTLEELSAYRKPELIHTAKETHSEYLLVIDNGMEDIFEAGNNEEINESTTFGHLQYIASAEDGSHLYIQDNGTDYLERCNEDTAIQFIVINKATGEIADVALFTASERINLQ